MQRQKNIFYVIISGTLQNQKNIIFQNVQCLTNVTTIKKLIRCHKL